MAQRISYVPYETLNSDMQGELQRCAEHGTPRPESSAVRAHSERSFWFFADSWQKIFREGVMDHALKELCRVYISRTVTCEFCGNQRSEKAAEQGLQEMQYDDLLNFESSSTYTDEQKAALRYAQAIAWGPASVDQDHMWDELSRFFTEEQIVELGCFIGLTFGQQSWIRLLGIDHHQYLAGTAASMAPGFEDASALASSKSSAEYWASS
ncbi:MAG: carboxymuconolactone decarboxylase [Candidatus Nanopelagicales bacterium]|nr:carboxymuconolactone decarboxylase [Candidatus Nanopelagicales bacterium]